MQAHLVAKVPLDVCGDQRIIVDVAHVSEQLASDIGYDQPTQLRIECAFEDCFVVKHRFILHRFGYPSIDILGDLAYLVVPVRSDQLKVGLMQQQLGWYTKGSVVFSHRYPLFN